MRAAISAILLSVAIASAQVKGPQDVTVPVGRLAAIPLTVDGDEADYAVLGAEVDALREYDPDPKKLRLRVIGYQPGVAWVVVSSVKAGKLQPLFVVRVTVGAGPAPGPGPQPPGPGPQPVPGPVDPAVKEVRDAAKADGWGPTELQKMATGIKAGRAITTSRAGWKVGELAIAIQREIRAATGVPTPNNLRMLLGAQLNAALPRDAEKTMTDDELNRLRTILDRQTMLCEEAAK